ncbi:MAG: hypothetical protein R2745_10895 [Vicinamibacterales bacterium]
MQINKLVFGGLVLGCLAAAAVGGYVANRQNVVPPPAATADPAAAPTPAAVTASEGVLPPESAPAAPAPAVEAPAAPAPRAESRPAPAPRRVEPRPAAPVRREAPRQAAVRRPVVEAAPAPAPAATAPDTATSSSGTMWEARPAVEPEVPERPVVEPEPVAPPEPEFLDLVVPADAVVGLQLESTVSSDSARVEDAVDARVTRDVRVSGRVAIPAGSVVHGTVIDVQRGGKVRERARLSIRFHTVVLGSGERLALRTDAVTREGASPGRESAAKIGGAAVGGAILGAILGGGKGAAIGAGVGAGGGTAAVMAGDRNVVTMPAGSTVSVRIQQPITVTVEKE